RMALLVLGHLGLQLRLAGVDILQLTLQARHPPPGRQGGAEERVGPQEEGEENTGSDEEPGQASARGVGHGRILRYYSTRGASAILRSGGPVELSRPRDVRRARGDLPR